MCRLFLLTMVILVMLAFKTLNFTLTSDISLLMFTNSKIKSLCS